MINLRKAKCSDAMAIAHLHAAGWRDTYRNVMSSEFLEKHATNERLSHWQSLFNQCCEDTAVFIVEKEENIEGFICVMLENDSQWGTYIDSLHVSSALRGQGAGKKLLHHAAEWVSSRDPDSPIYLWVFEDNIRATNFYQRLGGAIVEHTVSKISSTDNALVFRVVWNNAIQLMMKTR